jgi:RNAse (barnase) inhibitor barstar
LRADLTKFASATPPWVLVVTSTYDALDQFARDLRARSSMGAYVLRGINMSDREAMFNEFAGCLQFPHYFGRNWNAFIDCMRDLEWLPFKGFVIAVSDAHQLLVAGEPDEFKLLVRVLAECSEGMSRSDEFREARSLHLVLHALPRHASELTKRLAAIDPNLPVLEI